MSAIRKTIRGAIAVTTAAVAAMGPGSAFAQGSSADNNGTAAARDAIPAAEATAARIQSSIANYVASHGTKYSFASYYDVITGKIVVSTDAPMDVVNSLTAVSGARLAAASGTATVDGAAHATGRGAAVTEVQIRHGKISNQSGRRDDSAPFFGGGGLDEVPGRGWCSSGYTVKNSAGARFTTTAGHCFADGTTVFTESGGATVGTVSNRRLPSITGDAMDFELIGGQSYDGRIFTGDAFSNTSIPVVGAGNPTVGGSDYCHSGRTTGENCGHTIRSVSGQSCTKTGCVSPAIVFDGGTMTTGGDSGAPLYRRSGNGAMIVGHGIASDETNHTCYAMPWTTMQQALGLSIVVTGSPA